MERLIIARKHFPETGYGEASVIDTSPPELFVHHFRYHDEAYFFHNLSDSELVVNLDDLSIANEGLAEIFGDQLSKLEERRLTLSPFGYKWFKHKMHK